MGRHPDELALSDPINHVRGNQTAFHISHGEKDFEHVKTSSAEMVAALEAEGSPVSFEILEGLEHYGVNLSQGDKAGAWVRAARAALSRTKARQTP